MKKTIIASLIILFLLVLFVGSHFLMTFEKNRQTEIIENLLRVYYAPGNADTLNSIDAEKDPNQRFKIYEALYPDKYINYITKECFEKHIANRTILASEQVIKDFSCDLEITGMKIKKSADTIEGYPSYSFEVYIKVTSSNLEASEVVEKGSISFTKENDVWKISNFNVQVGSFYSNVQKLLVSQ